MSSRFYLIGFVFGVNQEIRRPGESKIPICNPSGGKRLLKPSSSYNKLLGRVA